MASTSTVDETGPQYGEGDQVRTIEGVYGEVTAVNPPEDDDYEDGEYTYDVDWEDGVKDTDLPESFFATIGF